MKSIILILICLGTFTFFFFTLSLFGLLWEDSYKAVICNSNWFILYLIIFGWWLPIFPAMEYYHLNEDYFDNL